MSPSSSQPQAQHQTQSRIAITRTPPSPIHAAGAQVDILADDVSSRSAALEFVRGAHVVVSMFSDRVDAEFLDAAGDQLKGVCNFAVGVDNIDLDACRDRGVRVTNTPHAVTEGTANQAWLLIMACARRLIEADRYARSAAYPEGGPLGMADFLGMDLTGKTLLIVGAGRIGYATALRSGPWRMRVLYTARSRHYDFEMAPLNAERVELDDGLAQADVVSIHTPLTPETRHLINADRLKLMKETAILVNTARGPIIDEAALGDVLSAGGLWGVGLDVFEHEPKIDPRLLASERAVLTPHIGSAEIRYRALMSEMVSENAAAILADQTPPNEVV